MDSSEIPHSIYEELEEKKMKLNSFTSIKSVQVPKEVKAELREYQKQGYNWLNFLSEYGWGGILADDMGLGKTLQVLSFIQKQTTISKKPNLVIVPTSLLFNWSNEINKFLPSLKFRLHHSSEKITDNENFNDYQLIITSYGTLVSDLKLFEKGDFHYVILDESQAIKNHDTRRAKAVRALKANNRLAMTGTPIENNTLELYSQMQFLNPGFLNTVSGFKENYAKKIEIDGDKDVAEELKRRIAPFILRRTKKQVLTELPPKMEAVTFCIMGNEQRKVYDAYRNKYRNFLLGKIEENGLNESKIYILEGLTKLRQICNSPQLVEEESTKLEAKESVKIQELIRNLKEKTTGSKVLVFSQFVKMLKLVEHELKANNITYEYLDGQTPQKKRQEKVENFQNNKDIKVFLISLKAGGTGLNLIAAEYVYILDPWWNPAVENQAIDRCYRMGQNKKVFAYKMICKDTIEEKIMEMQQHKKDLSNDLISGDGVMKKLTQEDIESLFS